MSGPVHWAPGEGYTVVTERDLAKEHGDEWGEAVAPEHGSVFSSLNHPNS